jgi:DNA helicase-2/ATP-dependent DNA helicase PcrA
MDLLEKLNDQQREAVSAGPGQTLVLAGPGSGKTRVLTRRIAYLIDQMGVRPFNILAVTFTNKAAREMGSRIEDLLGPNRLSGVWLGTFHSICARILRREAGSGFLPFDSNFVIFDADDQVSLVRQVVKDLNINDKIHRPHSLHAAISDAKNNMIGVKDYPARNYREEVVLRVYEQYEKALRANNAVDFDDLLLWTVRLLAENPQTRETYARKFEHVLVDEFQDTNMAQYEMLRYLASAHQNIFVVGDEDQSIYRWRGADYRNVLRFEKDYPRACKILLEQNYRSTQIVLDAARAVIDRNRHRTPKRLFTDRGMGSKLIFFEAPDERAEAAFIIDTIRNQTGRGETKGRDFAVMYRTNAQSRLIEEAFLHAGMPYRLVGAQRFYGRREVKDMIAFLRLVHNPADEVSLSRVINVPPRAIGSKTYDTLIALARNTGQRAGDTLAELGRAGSASPYWNQLGGRASAALANFGMMLAAWRALLVNGGSLPSLFDRILSDTRYREYIEDGTEEGRDRWENVDELRRLAFEYAERGLDEFLENLALVSDQDTIRESEDAPTLLTLHAAKGLEFNQVIITGLDEGLLPHSRSLEDDEEMAEERRLFYVGITRAKNQVYLLRSEQRSLYGSFAYQDASRFLNDIPENLLQSHSPRGSRAQRAASWDSADRWDSSSTWGKPEREAVNQSYRANVGSRAYNGPQPIKRSAPIIEQQYQPMMRVTHPTWGEGIVLESKVEDGDEIIKVHFETVGMKQLVASLAKLEIIR